MGAILTGLRGAALAAITGALCYGGLVAGLTLKWLSAPPDQPSAEPLYELGGQETLYYVVVNVLVLIVVTLLAGYLAERLRITGGQLERAEERAEQAEKMAALGRLAAGLAHEIRNPLGSIAGSIRLLQLGTGLSEEDRQLCDIIQREAARLNDLVGDMMDLSRPRKPEIVRVDVAHVAREVVELMRKSGRGVSDVNVAYRGLDDAAVRADAAQLRQLVWNLARNAVQASSAGDDVFIDVSRESDAVELAVVDHGVGIDEEAKQRLFDAFFTTRSKGTGVGLAVVKRIVDDHGFSIVVESTAGRGAVFRVRMPAEPNAPPADAPAA
jgi:signal transduction histidine kinase